MAKKSAIYISSENIYVVSAEKKRDALRIIDYFQIPLDEGTMINGIITQEEALRKKLLMVYTKGIREVSLIIDSGKILAKTTTIPKMKEKEIIQFIKDEVSVIDSNAKDLVYDYAYLGEDEEIKGASQTLYVAVSRELLKSYIDLFNEVGIEIKHIDYSTHILVLLARYLPGLIDKTYALCQFDGQHLISFLFINNEYILNNRTRIYAQKGTPEFINEVLSVISRMKQFVIGQGEQLDVLFFFGLESELEQQLFTQIENVFHIPTKNSHHSKSVYAVKEHEVPFNVNDYVYPVGYLWRK